MKKVKNISEISSKLEKIAGTIESLKAEPQVVEVLKGMLAVLVDIDEEMKAMKSHAVEIENDVCDLEERMNEVEDYLDSAGAIEPGYIECPFCGSDIELEEEFYTADEFKIICKSCNKEVEVITEYCDCEADGCGCDCDCDDESCQDDDCGCCCDEVEEKGKDKKKGKK